MYKIKNILLLFILLTNILLASSQIERKVLVLVPSNISVDTSQVHLRLESVLNYYGYYAEHISIDKETYPKDISKYAGLIYWNQGLIHKNPIKLAKFLATFKNKKNIFLGDIPTEDLHEKSHQKEVNKILNDAYGFHLGDTWIKNPTGISRTYDKNLFDFEMKVSFLNQKDFSQIISTNQKHDIVFRETINSIHSDSAFFAPWGFYATVSKVFYQNEDETKKGKNKWIINPFKLVSRVYKTNYPIPDTTTINGKRIAYIHIDGDGILSKSFEQKYNIETGFNFIKNQGLKTGVSYITMELDKKGPILSQYKSQKNTQFDAQTLNLFARKTLELPFVEPASHTYSHPFNWREGIVAYSADKNAKKKKHGDIHAYQEKTKQINLDLEIKDSIAYIQQLIPSKKVETIYWSGDCYPSLRDLEYIDKNNLLAFNGGDSRFDLEYNSYSYVSPLSLYSPLATQIYSSNSNENTYTELWTKNYWRFKNVVKTFKNTGYPKRIKPANAYYHFYSFEKKGSMNALKKIYQYYKQNKFEFIYPSEFIRIAKNFHNLKIKQEKNKFFISNIKELKEFRLEGKPKIQSKDIENMFYDKTLNVTYIRIKENLKNAIITIGD